MSLPTRSFSELGHQLVPFFAYENEMMREEDGLNPFISLSDASRCSSCMLTVSACAVCNASGSKQ